MIIDVSKSFNYIRLLIDQIFMVGIQDFLETCSNNPKSIEHQWNLQNGKFKEIFVF